MRTFEAHSGSQNEDGKFETSFSIICQPIRLHCWSVLLCCAAYAWMHGSAIVVDFCTPCRVYMAAGVKRSPRMCDLCDFRASAPCITML